MPRCSLWEKSNLERKVQAPHEALFPHGLQRYADPASRQASQTTAQTTNPWRRTNMQPLVAILPGMRFATISCTSTRGGTSVAADSVKREILIEASPEVIWGVITEPEQISRWFSDEAEVEARSGGAGTLTWRPGGRGGSQEVKMVAQILVV